MLKLSALSLSSQTIFKPTLRICRKFHLFSTPNFSVFTNFGIHKLFGLQINARWTVNLPFNITSKRWRCTKALTNQDPQSKDNANQSVEKDKKRDSNETKDKQPSAAQNNQTFPEQLVSVTFIDKGGKKRVVKDKVGTSLLQVAHNNDIDLEGACEGSLACSTCHVIVKDPEIYKSLGEPSDEENDMLDLAFGLTETSRLGCQIKLSPALEGMEVILPSATRNLAVDGYKPPKH